jgi:DNA-binding transcriptional LysR family regulator
MAFDSRQLRGFLAVVDHGSVGRAATAVNMSQPALSRLLGEMEARLDQRLFERHSKGMALAAAGETLVPHARLLLFEMEQAQDALDALRGLKRGTARIGAVATIARSILPDAVGKLLRAAPGVRVELMERPDDQLVTALLRRELDLIIAASVGTSEGVTAIAECRYDDVYAIFCAADHPLAQEAEPTLAMLLRERWVMPAVGATPRDLFEATVKAAGGSAPEVAVETGSLDAMVSFVARTGLLGWLPRPLLGGALALGGIRILNVPALAIRRRFFVYRRQRGLLPPAAVHLLDALPLIGRIGNAEAHGQHQ